MAVKHYDDTASAFCDVHAGEDAYGIWVAGALRPNVTAEQVRAIRAAAPSGDWRPINGRLEMVAVCQVNVPGFPVTRARVASGHVYALVAAGTATAEPDRGPRRTTRRWTRCWSGSTRWRPRSARRWTRRARRRWPGSTRSREEHAARLAAAREAALSRFNEHALAGGHRGPGAGRRADERRRAPVPRHRHRQAQGDGQEGPGDAGRSATRSPRGRPEERHPGLRPGRAEGEGRGPPPHQEAGARARQDRPDPRVVGSLADPFSDLAGEINDLAARLAMVSGAAPCRSSCTVTRRARQRRAAGRGRWPLPRRHAVEPAEPPAGREGQVPAGDRRAEVGPGGRGRDRRARSRA